MWHVASGQLNQQCANKPCKHSMWLSSKHTCNTNLHEISVLFIGSNPYWIYCKICLATYPCAATISSCGNGIHVTMQKRELYTFFVFYPQQKWVQPNFRQRSCINCVFYASLQSTAHLNAWQHASRWGCDNRSIYWCIPAKTNDCFMRKEQQLTSVVGIHRELSPLKKAWPEVSIFTSTIFQ